MAEDGELLDGSPFVFAGWNGSSNQSTGIIDVNIDHQNQFTEDVTI
jgi:uncharacterized repeat protein (TIGR02543 family)